MNTFKLTFAGNNIFTCNEVSDSHSLNRLYHYEHKKGELIYALVKANSEPEALAFVDIILGEIDQQRHPGMTL